jgi:hypothetical protein
MLTEISKKRKTQKIREKIELLWDRWEIVVLAARQSSTPENLINVGLGFVELRTKFFTP